MDFEEKGEKQRNRSVNPAVVQTEMVMKIRDRNRPAQDMFQRKRVSGLDDGRHVEVKERLFSLPFCHTRKYSYRQTCSMWGLGNIPYKEWLKECLAWRQSRYKHNLSIWKAPITSSTTAATLPLILVHLSVSPLTCKLLKGKNHSLSLNPHLLHCRHEW